MNRKLKQALSLLLTLSILLTGMVFSLPSASAAYPSNLSNGEQAVSYTAADAQAGKYLVEVAVVKYSLNYSEEPGAIASNAGTITLSYKPNNGTAPEKTEKYENIIPANALNSAGKGQFTYYAKLDGFPQKATVSVKKNNTDENDTGLYVGLKVWSVELGSFQAVYDFTAIEPSNGSNVNHLILTNITTQLQDYPVATTGTTSGGNLTLPTGLTPSSCAQTFSAVDQWGVTMIAPKFTYNSVIGLAFSQEKNVLTVKGTGDANNPNASTRTVSVKATYDTANDTIANTLSLSRSFTVTNSSNMTYAPTYANREKAGLFLSFSTSSGAADQFPLNSSYQMTTTNYIVLKNNSSRTARVTLSCASSDKFDFQTNSAVLAAGETKKIQILDKKSARANYSADVTAQYTLDGFYDAVTSSLVTLNTTGTIPFIYNSVTTPDVRLYDKNSAGLFNTTATVDVYTKYQSSHGVLNLISSSGQNNNANKQSLNANFYINTDLYPTYQSAGLGFYFKPNNDQSYKFQPNESDAGYYVQKPEYDNAGTFGFSTGAAGSAHTSRYCEKIAIGLSSSGTFVPFYGTIFKGSSSKDSPAEIYFDGDQDNDDGLDILATNGIYNSCYLNSHLYVYAYSKNSLRSTLNNRGNMLSCYYNSSKWSDYSSMGSSKLKDAQVMLGTDITSQYKVNQAKSSFETARNTLLNSATNGTYALIHYKHSGDMSAAINDTAVDFYYFSNGSTSTLKFNSDFADDCNKHTDTAKPTLNESGTFEQVYHYWNIDFSGLNEVLAQYNSVNKDGQFANTQEAVGEAYANAAAVDTGSATASPETQAEVDTIANELSNAMRALRYKSVDMLVTHKMLDSDGVYEINNDTVQTFTETYNKTATYGEVLDGLVNIDDGSYTIVNYHYNPVPDATFQEYASSYSLQGINVDKPVTEKKTIVITYIAKPIEDKELDNLYTQTITEINEWREEYTKSTLQSFIQWFNENDDELTQSFSVFDVEEYQELLQLYKDELDKLDPIITAEEKTQLNSVIAKYEMLEDFKDAVCNGKVILTQYQSSYDKANDILEKEAEHDAGSKAAQAVISEFDNFKLQFHGDGEYQLLTMPKDGIDGSYYQTCSKCGNVIKSDAFGSPKFNDYKVPGCDYGVRGASLRVQDEEVNSDVQDIRYAAACLVPKNAEVLDFGFLYTNTKNLNGGVEPTDNTAMNPDSFTEANANVNRFSMKDGNYTVHSTDKGSVYTFNLVLKLQKDMWNTHVAARSYVKYSIDGIEVTVLDSSYSSRTVLGIAKLIAANPNERPPYRHYITEKFGL